MKYSPTICRAIWLAAVGFTVPTPTVLAQPRTADGQFTIRDVSLQRGGLLTGQVLGADLAAFGRR